LPRGADEIPQHSHIRAISANAAGIHGQAEALGEIQIHSGVVEFRQAKASRRLNTVHTRWINRARRPVALPRTACYFVKLFPISFLPSVHAFTPALNIGCYFA
jgi:hypothetical protein